MSIYDVIVNKNYKFRKPKNVYEIFSMLNSDIGASVELFLQCDLF